MQIVKNEKQSVSKDGIRNEFELHLSNAYFVHSIGVPEAISTYAKLI